VLHGAAGYHVLTPLSSKAARSSTSRQPWLDRRGRALHAACGPDPENAQTIEGIAVTPSRRFVELAPEAASGPLRQNLVPGA